MKRSAIGWTDFSGVDLNFVIGCAPVSEGCSHCYAKTIIEDRGGRDCSKVNLYPEKLKRLHHSIFDQRGGEYRRGPDSKPMASAVNLGDLFHPDVPGEFIRKAFEVLDWRGEFVEFQVRTKRPDRPNWARMSFPKNLWLGVTVKSEQHLDRIDLVRESKVEVRFVSFEPLLESVESDLSGISWVVVGGESGITRRPFDPAEEPAGPGPPQPKPMPPNGTGMENIGVTSCSYSAVRWKKGGAAPESQKPEEVDLLRNGLDGDLLRRGFE